MQKSKNSNRREVNQPHPRCDSQRLAEPSSFPCFLPSLPVRARVRARGREPQRVAARSPLRSFSMARPTTTRAANMDFVEGAADKLAAIDTSTKRGEMSLESNKIDLMKQQLDFEKTDLFKGVSETIAGLEEKGMVYSTEMGYIATRAVKAKKVNK